MSDIAHTLSREAEAAKSLVASMNNVLTGDDDLTFDMIEGETGLVEAIAAAVDRLAEIESMQESIEARAKRLKLRGERLDAQSERLRAAIALAMEMATLKKVELAAATVSLRAVPPKAIISSEADLPSSFWRQPDPVIDKKAVLEALKAKQHVPGAELSNGGMSITVRFQ